MTLFVSAIVGFGVTYGLSAGASNFVNGNESCNGTCIALKGEGAHPTTIAVPVGSFVQFNSADGKSHSLSLGGGGEEHSHTGDFSSGTFGADEAWRVQFKDEGTFKFHDHLNPKINVLIIVYTPGKDYKVE
ncbi:hypothetical protein CYG49_01500 [Candidatus Saccharibacteria bacterium]|nr:MAG: hypothetical protein CYG49_01500 [Candidatus Saccharibacteria bacterium]